MTSTWLKYLFTDPLYVIQERDSTEKDPGRKSANEVTGNRMETLVLTLDRAASSNKQQQRELLDKILKAADLEEEDITIKNISDPAALPTTSEFRWVLSFGITPDENLPEYQITGYEDSQWIIADPLELLNSDKDKKRRLWDVLQQFMTLRRSP